MSAGTPDVVSIGRLKPHPRNYRIHPDDQLAHLAQSLKAYGFYRPVVVANDDTVLAGHGVLQAAKSIGIDEVPVVRFDFGPDDPRALKLVVADNEIGRLADIDDRTMTELLRDLVAAEQELLGTGFNEEQLSLLVMTTRSQSEIKDKDEAAEWLGLPSYASSGEKSYRLVVSFKSEAERKAFVDEHGFVILNAHSGVWATNWPTKVRERLMAVKMEG